VFEKSLEPSATKHCGTGGGGGGDDESIQFLYFS
jgi:hypothetical protein